MIAGSWYHASLKPIARSAGRSAVACAAYRTGARLEDARYGLVRDFERKSDVVTSFTVARDNAPEWAFDAASLWNAVEANENRKNSQLAFEWEVALPNELSAEQREAIARHISQWLVDEYGVAVTAGIHSGGERGNGKNDHAHIMMTTRAVGESGWAKTKLRDFSTKPGKANPEVDRVRGQIAEFINEALDEAGSSDRVDHRSYAERGIELEPTTHLGPAASGMERRGGDRAGRGDLNRAIVEERLAWQLEQAEPQITAELEQDLAARFGDRAGTSSPPSLPDADALIAEARAGTPVPDDLVAHAAAGMHAVDDGVASARRAPPPTPRGWLARLKQIGAELMELLRDEGRNNDPASEDTDDDEPEYGFAARLVRTGHKLWTGWSHRDGVRFTEGVEEAADLAKEGLKAVEAKSWSWRDLIDPTRARTERNEAGSSSGAVDADPFELMRGSEVSGDELPDVTDNDTHGGGSTPLTETCRDGPDLD